MLKEMYPGFVNGTSHALIPPIFVNEYPEQVGSDNKILRGPSTDVNNKQLLGAVTNKVGEDFETRVFRRFEQMLHPNVSDSPFKDCHLLWKGLTIPEYKVDALIDEDLAMREEIQKFRKKHSTKGSSFLGEADIVVLVKNVGLVVVEIKRSVKKVNNGIKQCERMAHFSAIVFDSCGPSDSSGPCSLLPVVKVVVVGDPPLGSAGKGTAPYIEKNEARDVWIFYQEATDEIDNFQLCWEMVLQELH